MKMFTKIPDGIFLSSHHPYLFLTLLAKAMMSIIKPENIEAAQTNVSMPPMSGGISGVTLNPIELFRDSKNA